MPEEPVSQPKVEAITKAVGELRFLVVNLHEIIDERLAPDDESWESVKGRLSSMEERLERLELSLSALEPAAEWIQEDLELLLKELSGAVEDLMAVRLEVHSFLEGGDLRIM